MGAPMNRRKHASKAAHEAYKAMMATEKRRILKNFGDTGITYRELMKAASESKLTPDFVWDRALKGQRFTSMKMKG